MWLHLFYGFTKANARKAIVSRKRYLWQSSVPVPKGSSVGEKDEKPKRFLNYVARPVL